MEERNDRILQLISLISKGALEYVQSAFERNEVTVLYYGESGSNRGVLCLAEDAGCVIAYAAFSQCGEPGVLLNLIDDRISPYLEPGNQREICFNVYGINTEIIEFVRKLGFVSDLEGYQLQYMGGLPDQADSLLLREQGYIPEMLGSFIILFDTAYEQLCMDNGWETGGYHRQAQWFGQRLEAYEAAGQIRSFWLQDRLAGAYITEWNFIRDLVVAPQLQNRGYGTFILSRCISSMLKQPDTGHIYLRVAASNEGAFRFYEQNQFIRIASFAEHTYRRQEQ
ncbi:GNAT family N-acetyltransferase [Paenibacillus camerounensis]|uniref:GNAT family N-acetyltransferase n=1 Tax=Paenibacillus camerounensis TaxID=1243663 RepID=UPI0005AA5968|nr:GNAT family N-acetyltransferase [Paenibacillus camerounensis]